MALAVEASGIGRAYGPVVALEGVDLAVQDGAFVSLLGPSGCGKSTLLRLIAGLDRPSAGRITVHGKVADAPPPGLGFVFQRDVLLDWRTVLDNVLLAAEFEGKRPRDHRDRALALLERFGLADHAARHPWQLSGGQRQRAAICRALLMEPKLLLMDEPFGALDAMTRDDLNVELARLWQASTEKGGRRTVVFVTHSIAEAVFLSDQVAVMSRGPGRVVQVFDIDLPRPRALAVRDTPEFAAQVAAIRRVFTELGVMQAA
jgi:NitT/TauT family transport system ATP-binding protein